MNLQRDLVEFPLAAQCFGRQDRLATLATAALLHLQRAADDGLDQAGAVDVADQTGLDEAAVAKDRVAVGDLENFGKTVRPNSSWAQPVTPPVAAVAPKVVEKPADKPVEKHTEKPAPKAEEKKPAVAEHKEEPKKEAAKPKAPAQTADDDAARALAILEGKPASAAAAPAPAEKKPAAAGGKFVIQVAALATQDKVNELRNKLSAAGIHSYTQKIATQAGDRTRIRVGPFASREEAERMGGRIKKLGLNATIVPA